MPCGKLHFVTVGKILQQIESSGLYKAKKIISLRGYVDGNKEIFGFCGKQACRIIQAKTVFELIDNFQKPSNETQVGFFKA